MLLLLLSLEETIRRRIQDYQVKPHAPTKNTKCYWCWKEPSAENTWPMGFNSLVLDTESLVRNSVSELITKKKKKKKRKKNFMSEWTLLLAYDNYLISCIFSAYYFISKSSRKDNGQWHLGLNQTFANPIICDLFFLFSNCLDFHSLMMKPTPAKNARIWRILLTKFGA